jgi:hypothetical protein
MSRFKRNQPRLSGAPATTGRLMDYDTYKGLLSRVRACRHERAQCRCDGTNYNEDRLREIAAAIAGK